MEASALMRWPGEWTQTEQGPRTNVAALGGAKVANARAALVDLEVPKLSRSPQPCHRGLGGPERNEAPGAKWRGPSSSPSEQCRRSHAAWALVETT